MMHTLTVPCVPEEILTGLTGFSWDQCEDWTMEEFVELKKTS